MQLTHVEDKRDVSRAVASWGWVRLGLSLCLLGLPVFLGCLGLQFAELRNSAVQKDESVQARVQGLRDQKADLERISQQTLIQLKALTLGLAGWHGGLARPGILGTGRVHTTGIDSSEGNESNESNENKVSPALLPAGVAGFARVETLQHQDRVSKAGDRGVPDPLLHASATAAARAMLALTSSATSFGYHFYHPLQRHKHGRLIDPAAYLHATIH